MLSRQAGLERVECPRLHRGQNGCEAARVNAGQVVRWNGGRDLSLPDVVLAGNRPATFSDELAYGAMVGSEGEGPVRGPVCIGELLS